MYTIEIRPINRAAGILASIKKYMDALNKQIPLLADATYGIMVKEAVNRGMVDLAMELTLDVHGNRIYRKAGTVVTQDQKKSGVAMSSKAMAKEEAAAAAKAAQKAAGPSQADISALIEDVIPRGVDSAREDMIDELR